jgi:hypothetical protein
MTNLDKEVYKYCKLMLGDGMIDVELDPEHYSIALDRALGVFRQRATMLWKKAMLFNTEENKTNTYYPRRYSRSDRFSDAVWDLAQAMAQAVQYLNPLI